MIDLINLASAMDEDQLRSIARTVIEEYEADEESRTEWLDMHAKWIDLYYQNDAPTNPPWEGASDSSMPLLAEACNQFHARAYQAIFPNQQVVKAIPVGNPDPGSIARAERVGRHMNWQLMTRDPRYQADKDALLLGLPRDGCFFTKTYFDPIKGRPRVENVRAEDLVMPYGIGPRALEDVERKTHVIYMSVHRTKVLAGMEYFLEPAEEWRKLEADRPTTQAIDDATGIHDAGVTRNGRGTARILEQHRLLDLDDDGIEEPYIVTVDYQAQKILRIAARYDVVNGQTLPIEYFTQYDFLPNPDGIYGLGMGHLIGKINKAVNKLLRMSEDAGELANIGNMSGFISDLLGAQGGEVEMELGQFKKVRNTTGRISDNIFQFQFPGPQPVLQQLMAALMARGDRLATVTEALTGAADKVMQPTALLALIDQGLQVFSTVYARVLRSMASELMKVYRLNGLYLSDVEYFSIQDIDGKVTAAEIHRTDYTPDLQVMPVSDPKMATEQQKLARAQAEYEVATTNPLIAQNPQSLYVATRRYLEAIGVRDIDSLLPRPPSPMQPVDDPNIENMQALLPGAPIPPVAPEQDHLAHIQEHDRLLTDPIYSAKIPTEQRAALEAHKQQHIAFLYAITELGLSNEQFAAFEAAGTLGTGAMAPAPMQPMASVGPGGGGTDGVSPLALLGGSGVEPVSGEAATSGLFG